MSKSQSGPTYEMINSPVALNGPTGILTAFTMRIQPTPRWAVAMFIHISAVPPPFPINVLFSELVSGDASHGSKRRLPWFYLEKAAKLFYSINLCTEPAAPVIGKINRCLILCL